MLLRAISGLIHPTTGAVIVDGKTLGKDIAFPEGVGLLIEKPEFLGHLTGMENLLFLAEIKEVIGKAEISSFMEMFDLDPKSKKPVKKYSLGMKQKLGIIQAIMENQQLLVLDEAFNALDEASVALLRKLLVEYKEQGKLIVITSHNKEDIDSICNYTYTIESGRIVA
jgi:ABC-2 type transport system ATP-binding protein